MTKQAKNKKKMFLKNQTALEVLKDIQRYQTWSETEVWSEKKALYYYLKYLLSHE